MSTDKKIHNLIEQQDNKGKEESWAKIQSKLADAEAESGSVDNGKNTRAVIFSGKAIISAICAAIVLIAAIILIVLIPRKSDGNNYFGSAGDYYTASSDNTLKDYAAQTGNDFLYFDWYGETDYEDSVIYANKTQEIICYIETIYDMEEDNFITFYITGLKTDIDVLSKFEACDNVHNFNGVEIRWADGASADLAVFEYGGFKYRIEVSGCASPKMLLSYVEQLLA